MGFPPLDANDGECRLISELCYKLVPELAFEQRLLENENREM